MKTLTELHEQDTERRQRAYEYERLTDRAVTLRATIARLDGAPIDLAPLRTIAELAPTVPADLITRSIGLAVPGGYLARDLLRAVAGQALADLEQKESRRVQSLDEARQELAKVEDTLKTFK